MTKKQKRAREINFSLMRLSCVIGNLKSIGVMYPDYSTFVETVIADIDFLSDRIKARRNNPEFIINFKK